jgi:hypothetical protein
MLFYLFVNGMVGTSHCEFSVNNGSPNLSVTITKLVFFFFKLILFGRWGGVVGNWYGWS